MDPEDRRRLIARSEVERRRPYIGQLENKLPSGEHHPLVQLMKRCLHNDPSERPTSEQLISSLEEMKINIEGPYGEVARADAVRQVVMMRALRKREIEVREKTDESAAKDEDIHHLQQELEHEQAELARFNEQLQLKDAQIQQKDTEIQQRDTQIQRQVVELQRKEEQLQEKDVQTKQLTVELQQKDAELNSIQENLLRLCVDLENREAQLRAQEEELEQRDADISRLLGELRQCQAQLHREQEKVDSINEEPSQLTKGQYIKQTSLAELKLPLKLKWKPGPGDCMPSNMADCQAVVIGNHVYVGGGDGCTNLQSQLVMVYEMSSGSWATLPRYDNKWFGMAAVNDRLVLVGGKRLSPKIVTNELAVWDEGLQSWTHPFPDMPTPRHSVSAVSFQRWLVVAGGDNLVGLNREVELLDTHSKIWYESSPLPKGCSTMSSIINGNMWYLLSGISSRSTLHHANKQVFSVCLDELISQATAVIQPGTGATPHSSPSPWQILTDTPVINSALCILHGALVIVGGSHSSAIHVYQPSSGRWVKVSNLPTQRSRCACIVLPSGEIFVAGGRNELGGQPHDFLNLYNIATIM